MRVMGGFGCNGIYFGTGGSETFFVLCTCEMMINNGVCAKQGLRIVYWVRWSVVCQHGNDAQELKISSSKKLTSSPPGLLWLSRPVVESVGVLGVLTITEAVERNILLLLTGLSLGSVAVVLLRMFFLGRRWSSGLVLLVTSVSYSLSRSCGDGDCIGRRTFGAFFFCRSAMSMCNH